MDKSLRQASSLQDMRERQLGLPLEDSLVFTSSDFFLHLVEELSDKSAKLLWAIIARIEKGDTSNCHYEFTNKEILEMLEINSSTNHTQLKKIFKELIACSVVIGADENEDTDRLRNIFDGVDFKRYSRTVTFQFRPELEPYLFNIQSSQMRAVLKYARKLSKRAAKLYFLLISQYKTLDREVEVEYLRQYLSLGDKEYPRFFDFKKYVLIPAINEINEKTDVDMKWEPIKQGRAITAIYFSYTEKYPEQSPRVQRNLDKPQTEGQGGDLKKFICADMGLDKKQAEELIGACTEEEIRGAYTLGISRIKNKNMRKSRGGYFSKSVHDLVIEFRDIEKKQIKNQADLLEEEKKKEEQTKVKAEENKVIDERADKVKIFLSDLGEEEVLNIKNAFVVERPEVKVWLKKIKIEDIDFLDKASVRFNFIEYIERTYFTEEA